MALPPFRVQAFCLAGLTRAFGPSRVLSGAPDAVEEASIRFLTVGGYGLIHIVGWYIRPAQGQRFLVASAQREAQHLPHPTRHRDPQPQRRGQTHTDFINLDHILVGRSYQSQRLAFYALCPFFRTLRTVLRLT